MIDPAMPRQLIDVFAKLKRATDHFHALNRETAAFLDSESNKLLVSVDAEKRVYTYTTQTVDEVPVVIRLLTGEVLGHFRSALDHLAWQLALQGGPGPTKTTEFPVVRFSADFTTKLRKQKIGTLPAEAQKIIEGLQPYHSAAPDDDPLWVLHRLTNDDKHRLPHLVLTCLGGLLLQPGASAVQGVAGPIRSNAKLGEVRLADNADPKMEVQTPFVLKLAFPDSSVAKGRDVLPELDKFGIHVEQLLRLFKRFF